MILKIFLEKKKLFAMSGEKLQRYQFKKIRKLLKRARSHSPYYSDLLKDVSIDGIDSVEKLQAIPLLTKELLRENIDRIRIPGDGAVGVSTSGSSGEPVRILKSKRSVIRTLITGHPFFVSRYTGLKINKTALVLIWGDNSVETLFSNPLEKYLKTEKVLINVMDPIQDVVSELLKEKPDMIITYPSMLRNIASEFEARGIRPDFLKLIVLSAELATPSYIGKYEDFFSCLILSAYISTETGMMAIDKPDHSNMYIVGDNAFLEVLKDGKPVWEEEGDIVVTELNNFAMPMIRYSGLCDKGILTRDNKGRRALKVLTGRQIQDLISAGGKHISAFYATEIIEGIPGIKKFRIVQRDVNSIFVELISEKKQGFLPGEETYELIRSEFEKVLGNSCKLEIKLCDLIKTEHADGTFDVVRRDF